MMSTRATACPPATMYAASALLASMFLLPMGASASGPASTPAPVQAPPAGTTAAAQGAAPATAADTAVAERATTAGAAPATAGAPAAPASEAAGTPTAPAAISAPPAPPAPSAAPAPPVPMPQAAPGPSTGSLLQTIFALVLVLALLAALAWAAKRYGPRVTGSSAHLRMVGALNLGGRERILVVEVGDQWIVVGASPGRVNALATMPKGDASASAALAGPTPSASNFADWLKQTIDKRNAK
ncbi:flagellar biosynthetic protein FliO [Massilia jejuensis]|uniref:Flagellar protein n=1 Tax=Massilia jejuensis TaxID=648894 RepID=A0ABW0PDJ3_9BURK